MESSAKSRQDLEAIVEAEAFAGGPMTAPSPLSSLTKTGHVIVMSKDNGDWQADCTHCGGGCGAIGISDDTDDRDHEDRMIADFTADHRDCTLPAEGGEELPSPSAMPARAARGKTAWIVRGTNGSDIRVLAERHTTFARPEGTELRFHDGDGGAQHRVATVRAGSWHWVVAEAALNPESGEK